MEPAGSGGTWTGSPKGVFAGRKHHKPRLALQNNTAGVREREEPNRTRAAGSRDEVEGVVANTLNLLPSGAVGFIDWLDDQISNLNRIAPWEGGRWRGCRVVYLIVEDDSRFGRD
jgi:hypothetical protein